MQPTSTPPADRIRLWAAGTVFAVGFSLAIALPITSREAYSFVHFVRPPVRDLLGAFDPADHILNTLLMKRAVGLLRLSAFSLRVPDLLGLALFLWAVVRLAARAGRWGSALLVAAGLCYLALEYTTAASAAGLALALWICGIERTISYLKGNQADGVRNLNLAGLCLGLSVAAHPCFLVPGLLVASALLLATRRFWPWMERVLITATVSAFLFLVLPFSHASAGQLVKLIAPPRLEITRTPEDLAGLVAVLRRETRGKTVRIAADAALVPVLEFYQSRYRVGGWSIVEFPSNADYIVIDTRAAPVTRRVLYRGRAVVLAR